MLQNTNKKSLVEGVTKRQKWKDSEVKEALQSGKDAESQREEKKLDRLRSKNAQKKSNQEEKEALHSS